MGLFRAAPAKKPKKTALFHVFSFTSHFAFRIIETIRTAARVSDGANCSM
jgi:hypothetical protein